MVKYVCEICNKVSMQKSHHEAHLETELHKVKVENFILKLDQRTTEQILEEYPQYSRNSVGFYDEDFLIDGEKSEDNINAIEIMGKTCKKDLIKRIINNKINQIHDNDYLMNDEETIDRLKEEITILKENNKKLIKKVNDMEVVLYQCNNSNIDITEELIKNSIDAGTSNHHYISLLIHRHYKDRYAYTGFTWYHYNESFWVQSENSTCDHLTNIILTEIYNIYYNYKIKLKDILLNNDTTDRYLNKQIIGCEKILIKLTNEKYINSLMKSLSIIFYDEDIINKFDSNTHLLGLNNGTIDFKNNVFRQSLHTDYITLSMGYSLDVDLNRLPIKLDEINNHLIENIPHYNELSTDLNRFIGEIIPDLKVRNYVLQFLAGCLSGGKNDEKMYMWIGSGGNGKSRLLGLMCKVLGEYSCHLPFANLTKCNNQELSSTKGKRLVIMKDIDDKNINVGLMKELISGDRLVTQGLYKNTIEFLPQFNLLLECNDLPKFPSYDQGTIRRLEIVKFYSKFVDCGNKNNDEHIYKRDKNISIKIDAWEQIFLGLLLEQWLKKETHIPPEIENNIKLLNTVFQRWLNECCEESPFIYINDKYTAPTAFEYLYENYVEWSQENNLKILSKHDFKNDILKWQNKSPYGLSLGKSTKDDCCNGTKRNPKFNLVLIT